MTKVSVDEGSLNEQQLKAVKHGSGPLMIIAGAGTGKTTVVTERIKYLIAKEIVKPEEILALTFTEKASREMEERVDKALPYGVTQMWISTFHAFCDRILRNEAINVGIDPGYTLMTEAETIMFFRKNIFRFDLNYFRPLGNPTKFIAGMVGHFSRLKDEDVTPTEYLKWAKSPGGKNQNSKSKINAKSKIQNGENDQNEGEKYFELANAYRTYEELKVKEGVCDYSDLISQVLLIFRTRPKILANYQNQFKYVLIDEFQDTNFAQNQLAILLAGRRKNITVVGDDDQAIYRWRGAAVSNMIQFRASFPKATIVVLTSNYRSTKEILDRSYDLVQHNNPDRLEVAEKIEKKLESARRINGEKIQVLFADRVENEADAVARKIVDVMKQHNEYSYSDIALLVRANNHADPFARAFARSGIPYQFLGPGQLYRQPEVKDLIAYLKVLYNFEDSVAMYRLLTMDWLNLPPRDVASLSNYAKRYGISIFEACEALSGNAPQNFLDPLLPSARVARSGQAQQDIAKFNLSEAEGLDKRSSKISPRVPTRIPRPFVTDETQKKVIQLVAMIHKHLGLIKRETAGQILYYFLEDTGLLKRLANYESVKDEKIALNISKFFNKLKTYEVEHDDASVFTVVDWIDLSMTLGESPMSTDADWSDNNAVTLMTVHSAKGLEFPVVFLVNLVSQRFPTTQRKEQIPIPEALIKEVLPTGDFHTQEERRLFYVGMTRARDLLFLTAAKFYGEGKREKKLSPFIAESLGTGFEDSIVIDEGRNTKQLSFLDWAKPEEPTKKMVGHPISYLSYSQLATFETCPLQYKYRYIIKIPIPPSAALSFGDTIHKVVRAFYELVKNGEHPTLETLFQLLDEHWVSVGFGNKAYEAKLKAHGKELLEGFFKKGYDPKTIPIALEEPFKIKITPELTLGGRIDRIDKHEDGTIEIIDYKTGQAPKSRDAARDEQLTVYALSAAQGGIYKDPPKKVIVSFYFFEGQEKLSATRNQEELALARKEIFEKAKLMEQSDFAPTPGRHCDFCEFRLICEAWN